MSDTIYRQDAIDAMRKLQQWNIMREDYKNVGFSYDDVMFTLEKLPPAQTDERLKKIANLLEGTIDHFDREDAMDLLYQIKGVLK